MVVAHLTQQAAGGARGGGRLLAAQRHRGDAPAAGQGGEGDQGAGDHADLQKAGGVVVIAQQQPAEHDADQAGDDRAGKSGGIEAGAQLGVGGELGRQGRVGQVDAGVKAVGDYRDQYEHHHPHPGIAGRQPPHTGHGQPQWRRTAHNPGQAGPPAAAGAVTEPAHQRIVDGIPEPGQHQHQPSHPGGQARSGCVKDEQIEANQ